MEGEQERLEQMYGELGDEHLRDLNDDRDSLTLDGQLALAKVLAARGLAAGPAAELPLAAVAGQELERGFTPGFPGIVPDSAGAMEQALEHGGERRDGMVRLVAFFDGGDLTRACEALDAKDVDFALEPMERDALSGAPTSFAIWVDEGERAVCEDVLRRKMGLFPLSEVEGEAGMVYDDAPMILGEFETKGEAERVKEMLAGAGIASVLHSSGEEGKMSHSVEVKGTDFERGLRVVETGLGVREAE